MGKYDEYFDQLAQRLGGHGFSVTRSIVSGSNRYELVAVRSAFEISKAGKMTRFIIATTLNQVNANIVKNYSKQATKYALDNRNSLLPRGLGGSLLSVPVIVSDDISEDVKNWMTNNLPEAHWVAYELPVLISPESNKIFYCKLTPYLGGGHYHGFRKFIEQELGFK